MTFLQPPFMTFDLAILMKKHGPASKIRNIHELGNQARIKYGIVDGGATKNFFTITQTGVYYTMRSVMDKSPDTSYLQNIEEGVRRVRQSTDSHPFVFIGEQHTLEYHASREPCDLTAVKAGAKEYMDANTGEYHLAVRQGLPDVTKRKLEEALTNLEDSGRLKELYKKWWVDRAQCSRAPSSTVTSVIGVLVPIVVVLSRVTGE